MRQNSESRVAGSHPVGYPSPFINVMDGGGDDGLPLVVAPVAIRACASRHVKLGMLKKGVGDIHPDLL